MTAGRGPDAARASSGRSDVRRAAMPLAEVVRSGFVEGAPPRLGRGARRRRARWSPRPATRPARSSRARRTSRCRPSAMLRAGLRLPDPADARAGRRQPLRRAVPHRAGPGDARRRRADRGRPALPARPAAVRAGPRRGAAGRRRADALLMNCSGKHAGMLLTCLVSRLADRRLPRPATIRCSGSCWPRSRSWPASRWPPSGSTAAARRSLALPCRAGAAAFLRLVTAAPGTRRAGGRRRDAGPPGAGRPAPARDDTLLMRGVPGCWPRAGPRASRRWPCRASARSRSRSTTARCGPGCPSWCRAAALVHRLGLDESRRSAPSAVPRSASVRSASSRVRRCDLINAS